MRKMGGRLFLMAGLCGTLAIGCAGLEAKRGVAGNVFFSSSKPKLNIEIAPDFHPLDEKSTSGSQFFADSAGSTNIEKELYRFINRADKREISIQFHRISANRVLVRRLFNYSLFTQPYLAKAMQIEGVGHGHWAWEAKIHALVSFGVGIELADEYVGSKWRVTASTDCACIEPFHLGEAELLVDRPLNPYEIANGGVE